MHSPKIYLFTMLMMFIFGFGCKSTKPLRPVERYLDMKESKYSVINIPIQLNLKELEQTINEQLTGLLYEDDGKTKGNEGLAIKASKRGDIQLELEGQTITYRVPLHLWIRKDIGFTSVEAEGAIELQFVTNYQIDKNWSMVTDTDLMQYVWKEKPVLKLGFVDVPINFIANRVVNRSKETITEMIDKQLKENFVLEDYIGQAWEQMQKPVLVSEEHELWVTFQPKNIAMTPLMKSGDLVSSTIVVNALSEVKFGAEPQQEKIPDLPPFQRVETAKDDFKLHLFTEISFKAAEKMSKKYIVGETFEQGGKKVKVEDLELYGQGDKMVINATLSGSYNGSIFLLGRPVYNEEKNEIEVEDIEYELNTKNFLYRSMGWLFKKNIKKRLVNALKFPLEENLEETRILIAEQLKNYEVSPNLLLQGDMNRLDIGHTFITPESIQLVITSQGRLHLLLKDLHDLQPIPNRFQTIK